MDSGNELLTLIVKQDGDAVGRLDGHTKASLASYDSIAIGRFAWPISPDYIERMSLARNEDRITRYGQNAHLARINAGLCTMTAFTGSKGCHCICYVIKYMHCLRFCGYKVLRL